MMSVYRSVCLSLSFCLFITYQSVILSAVLSICLSVCHFVHPSIQYLVISVCLLLSIADGESVYVSLAWYPVVSLLTWCLILLTACTRRASLTLPLCRLPSNRSPMATTPATRHTGESLSSITLSQSFLCSSLTDIIFAFICVRTESPRCL